MWTFKRSMLGQVKLLTNQVRAKSEQLERTLAEPPEEPIENEFESSIPQLQASLTTSNYEKAQARCVPGRQYLDATPTL